MFWWSKSSPTTTFFLSTGIRPSLLSPPQKKLKIKKIKFGIKIYFLKIIGTGHLIAKKNGGEK